MNPYLTSIAARAAALVLLLAAAGCATESTIGTGASTSASTSTSTSTGPDSASADGAVLARDACQVNTDPAAFAHAVDTHYREDILKAGLDAELAARPLSTIFTNEENLSLAQAAAVGRCERISYRSGGLRVTGYLLHPAAPGPHPVLIWLRGGNREFGKIDQIALLNLQYLADAGFIVLAPQYRGVDGGEGADEFGGADVDDVMALLPLARALPQADAARLYLLGGSRGAMQGTIAIRKGLPVRAAAYRGGVFDLKAALAARPELEPGWKQMMPDLGIDRDRALARRSAVAWAGELRVPTLQLHGRKDWRAPLSGAQAFDTLLDRAGVQRKMVIYERDEHQLAFYRPQWLTEAVAWFREHGAFNPP